MLKVWSLSVVALNLPVLSTTIPFSRISRPTRPLSRFALQTVAGQRMTNINADLVQFLRHPRPAIAAKAQPRLFLDVGQNDHVHVLPAAGGAAAYGPQATRAHVHHLTQPLGWKRTAVFFYKPEPYGFWLAKNWVAFFKMSLSSRSMRFSRRSRSFSSASSRSSCDTTSV